MTTLYLNRSFSATGFVLSDLRKRWQYDSLQIVMSHSSLDPHLIRCVDHLEVEPTFDLSHASGREAYLEYLLAQCERYRVDLFLPRHQATLIAEFRERFEALGVHVLLVGDADVYQLFDDKVSAAHRLESLGLVPSPHCELINSYESFLSAYKRLRAMPLGAPSSSGREQVCLKPNVGIGGRGFMRISHHRAERDDLFRESIHSISYQRLERGLVDIDPFPELLLSTYLTGVEYSVDCIAAQGELLAAYPRLYLNKHEQRFDHLPELIEICRNICAHFQLTYLFNVQFKEHRGAWYFIELNTRMAAGSHRVTALGISPLTTALELATQREISGRLSIEWGSVVRREERYVDASR